MRATTTSAARTTVFFLGVLTFLGGEVLLAPPVAAQAQVTIATRLVQGGRWVLELLVGYLTGKGLDRALGLDHLDELRELRNQIATAVSDPSADERRRDLAVVDRQIAAIEALLDDRVTREEALRLFDDLYAAIDGVAREVRRQADELAKLREEVNQLRGTAPSNGPAIAPPGSLPSTLVSGRATLDCPWNSRCEGVAFATGQVLVGETTDIRTGPATQFFTGPYPQFGVLRLGPRDFDSVRECPTITIQRGLSSVRSNYKHREYIAAGNVYCVTINQGLAYAKLVVDELATSGPTAYQVTLRYVLQRTGAASFR